MSDAYLTALVWASPSERLRPALERAIDYIEWLQHKGIVMSGSSSLSAECLDKIKKELEGK